MSVLVDTNVLLDVITSDPEWEDWSLGQLELLSLTQELVVNPIICAELCVRHRSRQELDVWLPETRFKRLPLPVESAFPAGQAFAAYRKRGGNRSTPLPDFFIGAHALVSGLVLLTRDAARYRTYFPKVKIIAPA